MLLGRKRRTSVSVSALQIAAGATIENERVYVPSLNMKHTSNTAAVLTSGPELVSDGFTPTFLMVCYVAYERNQIASA